MSFGSFSLTDASSIYFSGFDILEAQNMDPLLHHTQISVSPRPLLRNLFLIERNRKMYLFSLICIYVASVLCPVGASRLPIFISWSVVILNIRGMPIKTPSLQHPEKKRRKTGKCRKEWWRMIEKYTQDIQTIAYHILPKSTKNKFKIDPTCIEKCSLGPPGHPRAPVRERACDKNPFLMILAHFWAPFGLPFPQLFETVWDCFFH